MEKKDIKYTGKHIIFFGGGCVLPSLFRVINILPIHPHPLSKEKGEKKELIAN